jgi:phage/plasmid primase-like uncharacterized protein
MSAVFDEQQRIEAALACIPADLPRDDWARIGMALKHELGDAGFDLFDSWSQKGESYNAADVRDTWRSVSSAGGITISTLFHVAKEHGFDARGAGGVTVDPAEMERRRAGRERKSSEREARAVKASERAETVWQAATPAQADHPYMVRKGVQPTATLREIAADDLAALIKYQPKRGDDLLTGRILIAPVTVGDRLSTLEMIDGEGRKSALAYGVKAGGYWATQELPDSTDVVLIAEGVATALSASQCTGHPAVAALTNVNLSKVAEAMRTRYPGARLVLLVDLDKKSREPDNHAVKAAQAVDGGLAVPDFGNSPPENATDFNDLHIAKGADAVKRCITDASKPSPSVPPTVSAVMTIANEAIDRTIAGDAGALFEITDALRDLKSKTPADYFRIRARIRKDCRDVLISALEKQMRGDINVADERSVADLLIEVADERCELFHDPDRIAYALLEETGRRQCWPVRGDGFREWLSYTFYQQHGHAPTDLSITTALSTIEGKAKFDGDERRTHLRVASAEGSIWIDLCNEEWQAVEVTATGWRIVDAPPLYFVRTATMRALPMPVSEGSLAPLWEIVNIPESERLIVVTWLLECFRSATPYAVLELTGEQGSAKSTTQEYLRQLIDPNRSNNRSAPKSVDDVFIAAQNSHLVSMENLSHLHPAYQDALCVLATGGGYSTRRLFTNAEESVLDLKKPIVLNGIAVIVTAQDLSDRTVHIDLPTIEARATANQIKQLFETHRGSIFGALLDLLAKALAQLQTIHTEDRKLPRMADFAQLGEAVYRVYGKPPGAFISDYQEKRKESVHRTLEASPVAVAILAYLDDRPQGFEGTIGRLLEVLGDYRQDTESWPKSAKGMGDIFRRIAPALRQIGISAWASERRGKHGYQCSLKKIPDRHISLADVPTGDEVHQVHQVHPKTRIGVLGELGELQVMQQPRDEHIPNVDRRVKR